MPLNDSVQRLTSVGRPVSKAAVRRMMPAGVRLRLRRLLGSGREATSARYCYAVWMRHLLRAEDIGTTTEAAAVAELGPGASLGVGVAALLSGAGSYVGLDVVRHAATADSLQVFEDLVGMLEAHADIPSEDEFPEIRPRLDQFAFPDAILTEARLVSGLEATRINEIRRALARSEIRYIVPWDDPAVIEERSLDMVFSQAVMEHVGDLASTYRAIHRWLRPGGLMQHQVDLRSHGMHTAWNGHWAMGDRLWRFVRGDAGINREPASRHLQAIRAAGFTVLTWELEHRGDGLRRTELANRWRNLADSDLTAAAIFVQARRD
jgi:SAM-dependent methyltransferase